MAYASWPSALPVPMRDQFEESEADAGTISDPNDYGPGNSRAVTTGSKRAFALGFGLNDAQFIVADNFYTTTIKRVEYFYWTHPITGDTILVKMSGRPKRKPISYDYNLVTVRFVEV